MQGKPLSSAKKESHEDSKWRGHSSVAPHWPQELAPQYCILQNLGRKMQHLMLAQLLSGVALTSPPTSVSILLFRREMFTLSNCIFFILQVLALTVSGILGETFILNSCTMLGLTGLGRSLKRA